MYGIIVQELESDGSIKTNFNCYQADVPLQLIEEILSGRTMVDPDESILLLSDEVLAELDPIQYEILAAVQEDSALKDALAAANVEYGGTLAGSASTRKVRKHRSTVQNDPNAEHKRSIEVTPCTISIQKGPDVIDLIDDHLLSKKVIGVAESIQALEPVEATLSTSCHGKLEEYATLLTWLKVLGQPDDVILKKIASFEDYEERMKKLGAKLKRTQLI